MSSVTVVSSCSSSSNSFTSSNTATKILTHDSKILVVGHSYFKAYFIRQFLMKCFDDRIGLAESENYVYIFRDNPKNGR
ncbi:MAG: hypothetical protein WBF33_13515 [Candidatus Nitrosopolaris sp.]